MNRKINLIVLLFSLLLGVSCYEKDENYEYGPEVEFSISGVEKVYARKALVDTLHIDPIIHMDDLNHELEYEWSIFLNYEDDIYAPENVPVRVIGNAKTLNYFVVEKPESYSVVLKVVNKTTKQEIYAMTRLDVTNDFSEGFYVLKEVNDSTDMDLHTPANIVMEDLYYQTNGKRIPGIPSSFNVLLKYCYLDTTTAVYQPTTALAVATDREFHIVDIANLGTIFDNGTMFYSGKPTGGEPFHASFITNGAIYFAAEGAYFSAYDLIYGAGGSGKFGEKQSISGDYKPNKHVVIPSTGTYFFDELNGRFLACSDNGLLLPFDVSYYMNPSDPGMGYDPNNVPLELKFMGSHEMISDQPWAFAIMADQSGKSYLYELELPDAMEMVFADWWMDILYNPISAVTEITGEKIAQAKLWATNEKLARVIYFVTPDGNLYYYNVNEKLEEPLTLQGLGAGEEIVFLKNRFWTGSSDDDKNFNYLAVGTQSGDHYKVYFYELQGAIPVGAPVRILEGEGKLTSVHYVTSEYTPLTSRADYPLSY